MTDYTELIKALRCKVIQYEECEARGCKYIKNGWCYYYRMIDAADAIEALSKEILHLKMQMCCCPKPKEET